MDIAFWEGRWAEGRIGFHEGQPNGLLVRHLAKLGDARRVLVPLCGKTEDLAFLAASGLDVVGVEAVEPGARAFFEEHGLTPEVDEGPRAKRYRATASNGRTIEIHVGDWFAVTREDVGPVDAFYDRAALVAVAPADRARYVAHTRALVSSDARGLVVTFSYDPSRMAGPPYSIEDADLRPLWSGAEIDLLETRQGKNARLEQLGAEISESCYALALRGN